MTKPKNTATAPTPAATPAVDQPSASKPTLTTLLMACFKFDADADDESRQLLLATFENWEEWRGPFAVVMASKALRALDVYVSQDALEEPRFLTLLNLFARVVRYGGFRELLIERLLHNSEKELTFRDALAILAQEFQQKNADIGCAREALREYPEELASSILKAMDASPELRQQITTKLMK